ncbi:MAG: DUF116 domain-containing protein [Candidatus Diapherotrites archaeon]|nr:DUF116 domain-containing protein [Candidatus Diapherotrites archaeon]
MADRIKRAVAEFLDVTTNLDISEATQVVAQKLGLNERWTKYTHIEFRNKLNELAFRETPLEKRAVFLPHCIRKQNKCKGKYGKFGLECKGCGACQIAELIRISKEIGYKDIFVVPGGSMVIKIIKKIKPKAALGVACYNELNLAFNALRKLGVAAQGVLLLKEGCSETFTNIEEFREKAMLGVENANKIKKQKSD